MYNTVLYCAVLYCAVVAIDLLVKYRAPSCGIIIPKRPVFLEQGLQTSGMLLSLSALFVLQSMPGVTLCRAQASMTVLDNYAILYVELL
jgi:hypothetical protein